MRQDRNKKSTNRGSPGTAADTMRCLSEQVIKVHFPPPLEEYFDPYAKGEHCSWWPMVCYHMCTG